MQNTEELTMFINYSNNGMYDIKKENFFKLVFVSLETFPKN